MLSDNEPDMNEIMRPMQPVIGDRFSRYHRAEQVAPGSATTKTAVPPQLRRHSSKISAQGRTSRFWGSAAPDTMDRGAIAQAPRELFCLALPMPRLTAEIFEDAKAANANANERPQTGPFVRAEYRHIKTTADNIFIVKEAGSPRKRKASDSHDLPNTVYSRPETNARDHIQEHSDEFEKPLTVKFQERQDQNNNKLLSETKEEKRARRLESKRLKKEGLRGHEDAKPQKPREVEPFDYAYAPSALYPQRESNRMIAGREIDPYSKSNHAPGGLRKAKKEQEGKSLTFRG